MNKKEQDNFIKFINELDQKDKTELKELEKKLDVMKKAIKYQLHLAKNNIMEKVGKPAHGGRKK